MAVKIVLELCLDRAAAVTHEMEWELQSRPEQELYPLLTIRPPVEEGGVFSTVIRGVLT